MRSINEIGISPDIVLRTILATLYIRYTIFLEQSFEIEQSFIYIIVTFLADLNCEIAG
jgi:hypothetical protein